jgi:hypothetical protein
VSAPVGSLSAASATGMPYRSDEPFTRLIAAADAIAAAVRPMSSTTIRSQRVVVLATMTSMSSPSGTPGFCAVNGGD